VVPDGRPDAPSGPRRLLPPEDEAELMRRAEDLAVFIVDALAQRLGVLMALAPRSDGEVIATVPRGQHLRSWFTGEILRDRAAVLPEREGS
jgi:DNA mismatch repair protein MutH